MNINNLKKGMKVKNKYGNTHIFLEYINGEIWFTNRTANLEGEIYWEETEKINKKESPKYDEGKRDYTLLPINELEQVLDVLEFGAIKYSPNAWQGVDKGLERYKKAMLRHMMSYLKGEYTDSESGLSHLSHLATNVLFIMWFENNKEKSIEKKL